MGNINPKPARTEVTPSISLKRAASLATDLAPRREVIYDCPNGHETRMPMAADAELPANWECRTCGAAAQLRDGEAPAARAGKPTRTHWDMLLERRSLDDLEDVLNERLAELRPRPRKSA